MAADTGATQEQEKKKIEPRPYGVFVESSIDLSGDPAAVVEALKKAAGEDATKVTVLAKLGSSMGTNPKAALGRLAEAKSLEGSFKIIADKAVTPITVKVENKPKITFS